MLTVVIEGLVYDEVKIDVEEEEEEKAEEDCKEDDDEEDCNHAFFLAYQDNEGWLRICDSQPCVWGVRYRRHNSLRTVVVLALYAS